MRAGFPVIRKYSSIAILSGSMLANSGSHTKSLQQLTENRLNQTIKTTEKYITKQTPKSKRQLFKKFGELFKIKTSKEKESIKTTHNKSLIAQENNIFRQDGTIYEPMKEYSKLKPDFDAIKAAK